MKGAVSEGNIMLAKRRIQDTAWWLKIRERMVKTRPSTSTQEQD